MGGLAPPLPSDEECRSLLLRIKICDSSVHFLLTKVKEGAADYPSSHWVRIHPSEVPSPSLEPLASGGGSSNQQHQHGS